jgi:hypothetical protein
MGCFIGDFDQNARNHLFSLYLVLCFCVNSVMANKYKALQKQIWKERRKDKMCTSKRLILPNKKLFKKASLYINALIAFNGTEAELLKSLWLLL